MIRRAISPVLGSLSLLSLGAPAMGAPLQPLGPWDLDYGKTQCIASRTYGDASDPITLAIRQSPNGKSYEILVARKYRASEPATEEEATVDFGNGPVKAWALFYQTSSKTLDVHQLRISASDMAQARSANSVTLNISGWPDRSFQLALMPQLLDGLQTCTSDLQRYWNVDGRSAEVAKPARGDVRTVFNGDDYPEMARSLGQEGTGQYLLLVDEKGKVVGCQVLEATGARVLDAMACAVIEKRAMFTPARDRNGNPVRDSVTTPPIKWSLED